MLLFQLIAVVLSGFLDRVRGDAWHLLGYRTVDKLALGYCMSVVAGFPFDLLVTPLIVAAMMVGMSWGWGEPMGAAIVGRDMKPEKLEWWQVSVLKTNVWAALAARGALWGLPVGMVGAFVAPSLMWFVPIYTLAFPLSVVIGKKFGVDKAWEYSEYTRGWVAASLVFLSTLL